MQYRNKILRCKNLHKLISDGIFQWKTKSNSTQRNFSPLCNIISNSPYDLFVDLLRKSRMHSFFIHSEFSIRLIIFSFVCCYLRRCYCYWYYHSVIILLFVCSSFFLCFYIFSVSVSYCWSIRQGCWNIIYTALFDKFLFCQVFFLLMSNSLAGTFFTSHWPGNVCGKRNHIIRGNWCERVRFWSTATWLASEYFIALKFSFAL